MACYFCGLVPTLWPASYLLGSSQEANQRPLACPGISHNTCLLLSLSLLLIILQAVSISVSSSEPASRWRKSTTSPFNYKSSNKTKVSTSRFYTSIALYILETIQRYLFQATLSFSVFLLVFSQLSPSLCYIEALKIITRHTTTIQTYLTFLNKALYINTTILVNILIYTSIFIQVLLR